MITINVSKYQARQALNSYNYATDYLKGKSISHLEDESKYSEKLSNIREENGIFYYVRNTKESRYVFIIDKENMIVKPDVKINDQVYSIQNLKEFLNDLSPEEQKKNLENLYIGAFEKYLSKRTGIKIHLYKEIKQSKNGEYSLNLFTGNLIDKTGICKAMLKYINIECNGISYSIDYNTTGEQYLWIPTFDFRYDHINGGSNGYEVGRIKWNEKEASFYGYNYETGDYEVIE